MHSHWTKPLLRFGATLFLIAGSVSTAKAQSQGSDRCDAALLPQISRILESREAKVASLVLITEDNYEQARADGSINIFLSDLPIGASYQQFDEKRRNYLQSQSLNYEISEARSVFRQYLTPAQLTAWVTCMTSTSPGVRIVMFNDTKEGASAKVTYAEGPDRTKDFVGQLIGGTTGDGQTTVSFTLAHTGSTGFLLKRNSETTTIKFLVNGPGMTDIAQSLPPKDPPQECMPSSVRLLSQGAPATATSNSHEAAAAVDGNVISNWNALAPPTQSIEIDLGAERRVIFVRLSPEQNNAAYTEHRLTGRRVDGSVVAFPGANGTTVSGSFFTVDLNDRVGERIRWVKVETVRSPHWPSWREIHVYGCD